MSFYRFGAVVVAALAFSFSGCGGGPVDEKISVAGSAIVDNIRKTLEEFEKTGKTGSALTSLESDINGIKTTDSAKGEALHKGFLELQQANTPEKVKAAAKAMLSSL
jgi:hypothetical protein